ncbi:MAG: hypothetical protein IKX00_02070 [Bacilli bacterium]|nr:hypothetical protein [Bacilli bacterium]
MLNKIYERLKKFIIKNYKFIIFIIIATIILNIKTPYIVKAPGGIISLSDRVEINGNSINSNYYTSYVKVLDGKVASVIVSFIFPNWDIEKYEEYSGKSNLSYDELNKVEKLMMQEGNNKAIITALNKANINYELTNSKIIVYYKFDGYKNDLKIGDIINKCNNKSVENLEQLHECINKASDNVQLEIKRNNKNKNITAKLYDSENEKIIGIGVLNLYDIKSDYDIKIKSEESESGSSGGFMTTLAIYSELTNLKLPKNVKIAGTGTIEEDEKIGPIDAIKYKLLGAEKQKATVFFVPEENYKDAIKIKKKHKLKLKIIKVSKVDDAINYLNSLR